MDVRAEKYIKPQFQKDSGDTVFNTIKIRAKQIVKELEPERRGILTIKAILFPLLYIGAYVCAIVWGNYPWVLYCAYMMMGLMLVVVFLNLVHDAVHGTLFRNKNINKAFIYFFDLMGANSFVWKIRHTRLHHNYPNILEWDSDIDQSPLARIFPHGPFSRLHKYQHIYLPFIYPFYLLNWLLVRDFKDYFNKERVLWRVTDIPKKEYVKLFFFKAVFLFYTIVLPVLLTGISWLQSIFAFLIMMFTASITSLLVLLSPHANTEHDFPLVDDHHQIHSSWFMHQIGHTNDVDHDNWFVRFFMGSFNFHVIHHLFPRISHIYYPELTQMLKEEALKNDLPYKSFSLAYSLKSHYHLLKKNRQVENIFEETM